MTISQALRRIKALKGQMGELSARAERVVSYEETKKPDFDFIATRTELGRVREQLIGLEAAVARANATTTIVVDGREMTIAEAIRRLQECKAEMAWLPRLTLRHGVERTSELEYDPETSRPIRIKNEVTWVSALTEPARVAEVEALRTQFDRVNDAVETANHRTDIVEPQVAA